MKKIYLAGFDVFAPDAIQRGIKMKEICKQYGFKGAYPLDNEFDTAEEIFSANIGLIKDCDIIAANINEFRGNEPDSGTAFEIGYAYALGKKIYCYAEDTRTLRDKLGVKDNNGYNVENFNMPFNLMLCVPSVIVKGDFEDCIKQICKDLSKI